MKIGAAGIVALLAHQGQYARADFAHAGPAGAGTLALPSAAELPCDRQASIVDGIPDALSR